MTSNQKLFGGVAVVIAIVAIVFVTRKDDETKTTTTGSSSSSGTFTDTPNTTTLPTPSQTNAMPTPSASGITSAAPVDMETLAQEAKVIDAARAAIRGGDFRKALTEIERYEKIPGRASLQHEATLIKVESLAHVGRKTDALAIAMLTREDPSFAPYRDRLEAVLSDAGLVSAAPVTTVP